MNEKLHILISPCDLVPLELGDDCVPGDTLLLGLGHVLEGVAFNCHDRPHISLVWSDLKSELSLPSDICCLVEEAIF